MVTLFFLNVSLLFIYIPKLFQPPNNKPARDVDVALWPRRYAIRGS